MITAPECKSCHTWDFLYFNHILPHLGLFVCKSGWTWKMDPYFPPLVQVFPKLVFRKNVLSGLFSNCWIFQKCRACLISILATYQKVSQKLGGYHPDNLFKDFHNARCFRNIYLLLINANRLCLHVGLEFWTIFSFTCSESTSFTTCKFCFSTL